jgi:predicted acyltransferase
MLSSTQAAQATIGAAPLAEASGPARLVSLDVFRGMTVLLMMLVNFPGDWHYFYAPITHAPWHGCRPADLVFPGFLFIVGVSLVYALGSTRPDPARHRRALARVARRAAILFGMGVLIALLPHFYFTSFRIPGVLQRIALVFLVCASLFLKTNWRTQVWVLIGLLVGYNILMQLVPVPDYGPANLGTATNLGAWLDRIVFTPAHLMADKEGWDAESLLGTLPAIGTGLLGMLAGQWLRRTNLDAASKVAWLFVAGSAAIALGLIWNGWFPINKSLWTSSYVLYSGGILALVLAMLYWLCDVQGYRGFWTKIFLIYGVNAFAVYFLSEAVERVISRLKIHDATGEKVYIRDWLYTTYFTPHFTSPYHASLAWDLGYLLLWTLLLAWLYKRRIIIKV